MKDRSKYFSEIIKGLILSLALFLGSAPAGRAHAQTCAGSFKQVFLETFGNGPSAAPYFAPPLVFDDGTSTVNLTNGATKYRYWNPTDPSTCGYPTVGTCPGDLQDYWYTITQRPRYCHSDWINIADHTGDPNGNMLVVNAAPNPDITFYRKSVTNLCQNTTVKFSAWMVQVDGKVSYQICNKEPNGEPRVSQVIFEVDDPYGNKIDSLKTPEIHADSTENQKWQQFEFYFNTGSYTSVIVKLKNAAPGNCGNDLAIDDIKLEVCSPDFAAFPPTGPRCIGNAITFTSALSSGYNPPYYQWFKSTDGGTTYNPIPGADLSALPSTVDLADDGALYRVRAAGSLSDLQSANACSVTSNSVVLRVTKDNVIFGGLPQICQSASPVDLSLYVNLPNGSFSGQGVSGSFFDPTKVLPSSVTQLTYSYRSPTTNCITNTTANVTVVSAPRPTIFLPNGSLGCQGVGVEMDVQDVNAGDGIQWFDGSGNLIPGASGTSYIAQTSGKYTVTVTSSVGGCVGSTSETVTIIAPPGSKIDQGNNGIICSGNSITLTTSTTGVSNQWTFNNSKILATNVNSLAVTTAGIYTLAVTNASGCSDSVSYILNVNPAPTPSINYSAAIPFCPGGSVEFRTGGNNQGNYSLYQWFINNTPIIGATAKNYVATAAGNYTLTVTDANGCTGSAGPIAVTLLPIPPTPTVSASGPLDICQGQSLILTVTNYNPGYIYQWQKDGLTLPGSNSQTYTVQVSGVYTVKVTNGTGCAIVSTSITANVYPIPLASVGFSRLSLCKTGNAASDQIPLTAQVSPSGTYVYQWFIDGTPVGPPSASANTYNATVTGKYSFTATSTTGGCVGAATPVQITITNPPTPLIGPSAGYGPKFCAPGYTYLELQPGPTYSSYQWYRNGILLTGETTGVLKVTAGGDYQLKVTDGGCTGFSAPFTVTAYPNSPAQLKGPATPTVFGPYFICEGTPLNLFGNQPGPYKWYKDGSLIANTATNLQVTASGAYYFTYVDANGCTSASNIVNVTISPKPPATINAVSASGTVKICTGNTINLVLKDTYPAGTLFEWHQKVTGPPASNVIVAAYGVGTTTYSVPDVGTAYGTYYVNVKGPNPTFCLTKSNEIDVQYKQPPISSKNGGYICTSGTTPNSTNPITLNSPPGDTFQWEYSSVSNTGPFAIAPGVSTLTDYSATQAGWYRVQVTELGPPVCQATSAVIQLIQSQPLGVTINPVAPNVCAGQFASLTANITTGPADPNGVNYKYQWFFNGVPVPGGTFNTIGADRTGNWSVIVDQLGFCQASDVTAVTIKIPIKPVVSPSGLVNVCQGASKVLTVTNAASFSAINWIRNGVSTGITTASFTTTQFGNYAVVGTTIGSGCTDTSAVTTIAFQSIPNPSIFTTGPTIFCEGGSTRVYVNSSDGATALNDDTYQWARSTTGPGGPYIDIAPGGTAFDLTITQAGDYRITETTTGGCSNTAFINIQTFLVKDPIISGVLEFCDQGTTTLTSNFTAADSFEWDFNTLGNLISDQPSIAVSTAGDYYLVSKNPSNRNCTKSVKVTVTQNPLPVTDFRLPDGCEPNNTVTFKNLSTISDGTALTSTWNFGGPNPTQNASATGDGVHDYPNPVAPVTYPVTLTVTSAKGCVTTVKQDYIFKGSQPVAGFTVAGGNAVCAGQTVNLQDNSTVFYGTISSYVWTIFDEAGKGIPILISPVANTAVVLPDSTKDAKYTVFLTVTSNTGCKDVTSQVLTAKGKIKATLKLPINQACVLTAPVVLTGGLPVNGTNGGQGAYSGPGVTSGTFYPAVAGVGKHTIVYSFFDPATGCSSFATDTIRVQVAPTAVTLTTPPGYKPCDTTVLLQAAGTGGKLFTWYRTLASGADTLLQSDARDTLRAKIGGTYRVRISNQFGCYSDASLDVVLYPNAKPVFDIANICADLVATFSNGTKVSDGSSVQYEWNFGDPASGANNISTTPVPVHQFTSTGSTVITLKTTTTKGCVQVLSKTFSISNIDTMVNFNIRTTRPFCTKEPIVFVDSSFLPKSTILSYKWVVLDAAGNDLKLTNATTGIVSITFPDVTVPTTFTIREIINTAGNCPLQSKDKLITINPGTPLTYVRERGADVCRQDPPFRLSGGTTVPPGQPGKGYYTGSGVKDSTTFVPGAASGGDNTVSYVFTNQYGCQSLAQTQYVVHDTLVLNPKVTNFNVLEGDQVTLNGIGTLPFIFGANYITSINADSLDWKWTPAAGLSSTTSPTPTLTAGSTTSYLLTITPHYGCPSRALFVVVVHKRLRIPNAFSPNGDGTNDTWIITGIDNYPNAEVYLFNRWGQQLWYSRGYGTPWNGMYNGKPLPMGTYYYLIKRNKAGEEQPLSGPLTIIY